MKICLFYFFIFLASSEFFIFSLSSYDHESHDLIITLMYVGCLWPFVMLFQTVYGLGPSPWSGGWWVSASVLYTTFENGYLIITTHFYSRVLIHVSMCHCRNLVPVHFHRTTHITYWLCSQSFTKNLICLLSVMNHEIGGSQRVRIEGKTGHSVYRPGVIHDEVGRSRSGDWKQGWIVGLHRSWQSIRANHLGWQKHNFF